MPEITVIVPVYKVEPYLETCVNSILAQTFTDYEILLIDDGSPDSCGEICDAFEKRYPFIKAVHCENGGLSAARNVGITQAKGRYLSFIDSDDFIAPDMLETFYRLITDNQADISACGIMDCFGERKTLRCPAGQTIICNAEKGIRIILAGEKLSVNAVNKLYKKSLFDNIRFPVGKTSEDAFVMIKLFGLAATVAITTDPKYFYIHREDSITTKDYRPSDLAVIEAYEQNFQYIRKAYPSLEQQAEFRWLWSYWYILEKMVFSTKMEYDGDRKKIILFLRKKMGRVLRNPYFSKKRKLVALTLMINWNLYRRITLKQKSYRRKNI